MVQMKLFAKQEERHRHRKQMYGHQVEEKRGLMSWEIGNDIYTLLCINKIDN